MNATRANNVCLFSACPDKQSLEKSLLPPKALFSKSDEELSIDSYEPLEGDNLLHVKQISSSTGSLATPSLGHFKPNKKVVLVNFMNISEEKAERGERNGETSSHWTFKAFGKAKSEPLPGKTKTKASSLQDINIATTKVRFSRQLSEPGVCSTKTESESTENDLVRQNSDPVFPVTRKPNIEIVFSPTSSMPDLKSEISPEKLLAETSTSSKTSTYSPPTAMSKFWNSYTAHTSTPAKNLFRKSLAAAAAAANECLLTPIPNNDKSMSPITQSTTKMSKAMQVRMHMFTCFYSSASCILLHVVLSQFIQGAYKV